MHILLKKEKKNKLFTNMVYFPLAVSTIVSFMSFASAEYVKLDVDKLRGSWSQNADIDKSPIFGYYKETSPTVNGTVAGPFDDKVFFAVHLGVGSNSQNMTVLVDTLSSDLWINSIENAVCANNLEPVTNFTVRYESTSTIKASTAIKSSSFASTSKFVEPVSTSYSSYYDSASDVYYVDAHVITDVRSIFTTTQTHSTLTSIDTHFYPSVSFSTDFQSSYPQPTLVIDNLEILEFEPQNCSSWGLFNSSISNSFITYNETFESVSVDGEPVAGIWAKDLVTFGDAMITNMTFGLVNSSESDSFGVLGLGLPSAEASWLKNGTMYENFPLRLHSDGLIDKVVYSLYDNYLLNGSSLLFGGVDLEQFIGNLSIVPLVEVPFAFNDSRNASAIAITLSSIHFDNNINGKHNSSLIASGLGAAVIDTSASTGSLPYYIYDEIVAFSGFEYSESLHAFFANETQLENKTLTFDFQGVEIEVPILDLTFPLVDISTGDVSDFVVLGVDAIASDIIILGDAILQSIYIAIDLQDSEVALAPKNFSPTTEKIVAIKSTFPNATTAPSFNFTYGYHGVTNLRLATVDNLNTITKTSFSITYEPSQTPFKSTKASSKIFTSSVKH